MQKSDLTNIVNRRNPALSIGLLQEKPDIGTSREVAAKDLINNLQKIKHHGKRADSIIKQLQDHTKKGTAHEFFEGD